MNGSIKTVAIFIVIWLGALAVYLYYSEAITKHLFPGYDHVDLWLMVLILGWTIIFALVFLLLGIWLIRRKRKMAKQ